GIGISAYAAHNIAGQIESFSYLPAMAFGTASATLIGQSLGIGEKETAEKYGYISFITSSLIMVIIGIFFFFYSKELVMILTDDKKVIEYSSDVLRLIALFQPFLASTQVISSSLQGAGDTKFPMYLTIVGIWGIRVLGLYIVSLYINLNLYIVWISYVVEIIFRGSLLFIRFYKGNWKNISIGEC
ncbi:MAG TPA: MATE family efflux transporter, partial [Tissierellaceae bacterium]